MIPTINTLPTLVAASPLRAIMRDGECVAPGTGPGAAVTSGVGLGATGVSEGGGLRGTGSSEGGGLGGAGLLLGVELGDTGMGVGGAVVTAAELEGTGERSVVAATVRVRSGETGVAVEEETLVVGLGPAEVPVDDGTTSGLAVGCVSSPLPSPLSSPSPRLGVMVGTVWRWGLCHGAAQA